MFFVILLSVCLLLVRSILVSPDGQVIRDAARALYFKSLKGVDNKRLTLSVPEDVLTYPTNQTLYIIADLHGDFLATISLLYAGGLIDRLGRWVGGSSLVVQMGDIADRGPDSPAIYELFWKLGDEARESGGNIYQLFGNHEIMNLMKQTHYVAQREMSYYYNGSTEVAHDIWDPVEGALGARIMQHFRVSQRIGDLKFIHAGLLPDIAAMDPVKLDHDVKAAVIAYHQGDVDKYREHRALLEGDSSPIWTRTLTHDKSKKDRCRLVAKALNETSGITRQFVGHTPTKSLRVEPYCDDTFIQTDTGNSRWMYNSQTMIRVLMSRELTADSWTYDRTFEEAHIKSLPLSKDKPLSVEWVTLFSDNVCYDQHQSMIRCGKVDLTKNDEL